MPASAIADLEAPTSAYDAVVITTYQEVALNYTNRGYWVTPIKDGSQAPYLPNWQHRWIKPNEVMDIFSTVPQMGRSTCGGIGLVLGQPIQPDPTKPPVYLYSIDVDTDDPEIIYAAQQALGKPHIAKFGSKGVNFFCRSDAQIKYFQVKRDKREAAGIVEFLGHLRQTVIPPTVHCKTGKPYKWLTRSLLDIDIMDLPVVDDSVIAELKTLGGEGSPILNLNTMHWAGEGEGGDTHETCLRAVAAMVSLGWTDEQILRRVDRAKASACKRAGMDYHWPDAERVMQGWIDSARGKGYDEGAPETAQPTRSEGKEPRKKRPSVRPSVRDMADWSLAHLGGPEELWKYTGQLRRYRDGCWAAVDEGALGHTLILEFPKSTDSEVSSAVSTLKLMIKEQPSKNARAMCLLNGTYDLDSGILREWRKEDRLMVQLPITYDPEAPCPNYEKHIRRLFHQHRDETYEKDDRTVTDLEFCRDVSIAAYEEFCGLTLVDDMTFQKAMIIKGAPGGGKGTLIKLLRSMHGVGKTDIDTVGSVLLHELSDIRIRTALVGKLVNISPELNAKRPLAVTEFKAITGEDHVTIRRLYEDLLPAVKLPTRFVTFCNHLPEYEDDSGAIERRLLVIPCDNAIPADDRNPAHFEENIEPELSGIFNRWTAALRNLYRRKHFQEPSSSARTLAAMKIENSTVLMWLHERAEMEEDGKAFVKGPPLETRAVYADYTTWCEAYNYKPLAAVKWGSGMKISGIPPTIVRVGKEVKRCRCIKLKSSGDF